MTGKYGKGGTKPERRWSRAFSPLESSSGRELKVERRDKTGSVGNGNEEKGQTGGGDTYASSLGGGLGGRTRKRNEKRRERIHRA